MPTFGKYHILEKLADSGLIEVYKAKTIGVAGFEKVQILVRIRELHAANAEFVSSFVEAAKLAFSLNHRNIVQVFEFGKLGGELYIATEHIPGVNLSDILAFITERQTPLPLEIACFLMGEVAAGLNYAHRKVDQFGLPLNIIHGALDPSVIACSWEGSVKLLDFGLSQAAWSVSSLRASSRPALVYRSPEHFRGEPLTDRSDVFALGAILWHLLVGHPAVVGDSAEEIAHRVLTEPVPDPRDFCATVPAVLANLVLACLARDADRRVDSANTAQLELHRVQRQIGSIIGSRTLSAFLESFDTFGSERDVRQSSSSGDLSPIDSQSLLPSVSYGREHSESIEVRETPTIESEPGVAHASSSAGEERAWEQPTEDGRTSKWGKKPLASAGLLHPPRLPDEPGPSAATSHRQPSAAPGQEHRTDEATLTSETFHDGARIPPAPPPTATDAPRITLVVTRTDEEFNEAAESDELRLLAEKKRFFAVCVAVEGPVEAYSEAMALISDIAYKNEALVHSAGDSDLIAIFGLPTADEHDVVSAVRFCNEIKDALRYVPRRDEMDRVGESRRGLRVTFGLRSGTTRVRLRANEAQYQLQGRTIDETMALAAHAEHGEILVAGAAARLASLHYLVREADFIRLHGKPTRCYRIVEPLPSARRSDAGTFFVGRELELKALRDLWREAVLERRRRSVLVMGEPGIGKTRLVDEFLLRNSDEAVVLLAAASVHRQEVPFALLVELLRAVAERQSGGRAHSRSRLLDQLEQLYEGAGQKPWEEVKPTYEAILDPARLNEPEFAPDRGRARILQALRKLLVISAGELPLVFVVENLQWADGPSRECLDSMLLETRESTGPQLFVITMRSDDDAYRRRLSEADAASIIELDELPEAERRSLAAEVLGSRSSPALLEDLIRRSGGNPFYVNELAAAVREEGDAIRLAVPLNLQGLIADRIDRLPPNLRATLQHAAVMGPVFRESVLRTLLGRDPGPTLAELRQRGFLVHGVAWDSASPGVSVANEPYEREWSFRHAVVQELIYESIAGGDRRQLHQDVGQLMAARYERRLGDHPAEIGRHFELAGRSDLGAPYYLKAADQAAAAHANREALRLYEQALKANSESVEQRFAATAGREQIYGRLGNYELQLGELRALWKFSGLDPAKLAHSGIRQTQFCLRVGRYPEALQSSVDAAERAAEAGSELLRAEALRLQSEVHERLNDYAKAMSCATEAVVVFEQEGAKTHLATANVSLGRIMQSLARYQEALKYFRRALELIRQDNNRWQERVLRNNLAATYVCCGEFTRALQEAEVGRRLCAEFSDRVGEGDATSLLGVIYLQLGLYEQAVEQLHQGLRIHRETGARWGEADTLVYCGLAELALNRADNAILIVSAAGVIANELGAQYVTICCHNAMALALCERENKDDVAAAFDEATAAYEKAQGIALVVGEIPGLSRAARASTQLGNLEIARQLSERAVERLIAQQKIEGPEEEIYFTHYKILKALEDPRAAFYLELAHKELDAKARSIADDEQRAAFCAIPLNAAVLAAVSSGLESGSGPAE